MQNCNYEESLKMPKSNYKKNRQNNERKKEKKANNGQQNTTEKTKDYTTRKVAVSLFSDSRNLWAVMKAGGLAL